MKVAKTTAALAICVMQCSEPIEAKHLKHVKHRKHLKPHSKNKVQIKKDEHIFETLDE